MIKYGKLKLSPERADGGFNGTTVYGWICEGGIIEAFATNPSASGTSDAMLGKFHAVDFRQRVEEITQPQFNAAFLIWPSEAEVVSSEHDKLCLGELMTKYPVEN